MSDTPVEYRDGVRFVGDYMLAPAGDAPSPEFVATLATAINSGLAQLLAFLRAKNLKPFIFNDLVRSSTPIVFESERRGGAGGSRALGYRAQVLPRAGAAELITSEANEMRVAARGTDVVILFSKPIGGVMHHYPVCVWDAG